jgi:glycosyltransferase involved in cell wall biosynthesis
MAVAISVIIEMFNAEVGSDVTVEEAFGSLGTQDYPAEEVEFLVVAPEETAALREAVRRGFGRLAPRVRIVASERGYHQAKLRGIEQATGRAIAFSDSDNIQPAGWLRCLHEQLLDAGRAAVTGGTSFKPGTILRWAIFLADFGILREDGLEWTPYFWPNNAGFRRDVLLSLQLDDGGAFRRFGGSRFLARQLHERGLQVRVDPRMTSVHGFNWRVCMYEKRLRRFIHLAYVRRHDPDSGLSALAGAPDRPLSWLWSWLSAAYRYQRQPGLCRTTLALGPGRRSALRVLLAGLSLYELALILYVTAFPGALRRLARAYDWWPDPAGDTAPTA